MSIVCPKCRYQRGAGDRHVHEGICPACGIAYLKYRVADDAETNAQQQDGNLEWLQEPTVGIGRRLFNACTYVPEEIGGGVFWGRVALYALFVAWGISFIVGGIDWESIGGSFLHNVNLPFHEFGHVLFGFFGRFMGILGGSLFQVLFPLVFVFAFSWKMRNNFAASICLWWCGQNFIDVSPYIADAEYRAIPLIRGLGEEYHDWGNLLTMTDAVDSARSLALTSFSIGTLIILFSFVWGAYILWLQYKRRSTTD